MLSTSFSPDLDKPDKEKILNQKSDLVNTDTMY